MGLGASSALTTRAGTGDGGTRSRHNRLQRVGPSLKYSSTVIEEFPDASKPLPTRDRGLGELGQSAGKSYWNRCLSADTTESKTSTARPPMSIAVRVNETTGTPG